jgi:hypothetical protein
MKSVAIIILNWIGFDVPVECLHFGLSSLQRTDR